MALNGESHEKVGWNELGFRLRSTLKKFNEFIESALRKSALMMWMTDIQILSPEINAL